MIPKIIHYVWLSNEPINSVLQSYIETWKRFNPDYQIKRWTMDCIECSKDSFVYLAFKHRKWAFASDYIRMYAIYTQGGIYLDSDVEVKASFDNYLNFNFFTSLEYHKEVVNSLDMSCYLDPEGRSINGGSIPGIGIQAAVLGGEKGNLYAKACLDWFDAQHQLLKIYGTSIIAPSAYANVAEKFGFVYQNRRQILSLGDEQQMIVEPSEYFCSKGQETSNTIAVHQCHGSWRPKSLKQKIYNFCLSIYHKLKSSNFLK